MAVTAKLRYLRIAPRKVRLVANLIRGKTFEEAQTILNFTVKKGAQPLLKLLKSAVASAKNSFKLEETSLYISKITVDEGPKYKRWMPRARGQASQIQKKTSHITLVLETSGKLPARIKKAKKMKKAEEEMIIPAPKKEKPKLEKPRLKPKIEMVRPRTEKGLRKIFRRKSF